MNPTDFLNQLKKDRAYQNQLVHVERLGGRGARYASLEKPLLRSLVEAIKAGGAERLYSHQAQAIDAARAGRHVVVATSTASGKTLCYNVPVLEAVAANYQARAIYLFPTKALAQDQLRSLKNLTQRFKAAAENNGGPLPTLRFGTYDGDTPQNSRTRLRREGNIILTNPDMLHVGILPNHRLWSHFLKNLKFVVVDEAHIYRGVFGSHVSLIFRRLARLCELYGNQPQFICCSATIANPGDHIERLTGFRPVVVDDDGSPQAPKQFALWNPPFIDDKKSTRRSPNSEAAALFAELIRHQVRNITFTKARVVAELILSYARQTLDQTAPELTGRIASYRAGYLAEHRREIEQSLFHGQLIGVTATSALELGVDVGDLDATVSVGYPGTVASLWQQAGRAGRSRNSSLAVLVGLDNPLDQYFMRHPDQLFGRPHEHALIDPQNIYILEQHLPCAAHEEPLSADDQKYFGPGFIEAMVSLEERSVVVYEANHDRWYFRGQGYPAQQVGIRSVGSRPIALVDDKSKKRLEEMDEASAFSRVHPGAIYLHQGESYEVVELDLQKSQATLRPTKVDYYTQAREVSDIDIIRSYQHKQLKYGNVFWGAVRVTQQVVSYRRVRQYSEANLGDTPLEMPANTFETRAMWWDVPVEWAQHLARRGWDFLGGLHAVEHAAIGLLPLYAMCDRWDIGGLSTPMHPATQQPQIFIYDGYPGGVGITEQGFELLADLWEATLATIKECPCEDGCPSCIHSPKCGNNNEPLDKRAAAWILESLLKN
ncbi:MAG: DEAD/DEAH box helicase [Anaerolineales bacterium]|nr:DEAD/DEAH box helicase [Anaerolineales bacterium]